MQKQQLKRNLRYDLVPVCVNIECKKWTHDWKKYMGFLILLISITLAFISQQHQPNNWLTKNANLKKKWKGVQEMLNKATYVKSCIENLKQIDKIRKKKQNKEKSQAYVFGYLLCFISCIFFQKWWPLSLSGVLFSPSVCENSFTFPVAVRSGCFWNITFFYAVKTGWVCVYIYISVSYVCVYMKWNDVGWHYHRYIIIILTYHASCIMPWFGGNSYSLALPDFTPRDPHWPNRFDCFLKCGTRARALNASLRVFLLTQRFGNVSVSDF